MFFSFILLWREIAATAAFPAVSLPGVLAGKIFSLPGDAVRPSVVPLTRCLKGDSRRMRQAISEPDAIFS